jgi:hypothetical protein
LCGQHEARRRRDREASVRSRACKNPAEEAVANLVDLTIRVRVRVRVSVRVRVTVWVRIRVRVRVRVRVKG